MDVLLQRLKCWKLPLTPTGFLQRHAQWPQKTGQLTGQKVVHLGIFEDEMTGYHNCFTGSLNYWQSKSTGGKYAPSQALNTTEAHYVYTVHPQLSFTLLLMLIIYNNNNYCYYRLSWVTKGLPHGNFLKDFCHMFFMRQAKSEEVTVVLVVRKYKHTDV